LRTGFLKKKWKAGFRPRAAGGNPGGLSGSPGEPVNGSAEAVGDRPLQLVSGAGPGRGAQTSGAETSPDSPGVGSRGDAHGRGEPVVRL